MIEKFTIDIPEHAMVDLKGRLGKTRWPDEISGSGWNYGANLSYVQEIIDYWENKFDWRKTEREMNSFPNYMAEIDGVRIHFIHIKGKGKESIPLLITHGWPGSVLEMFRLIPLLTRDGTTSFDLIIPSIPGFGFSQKVTSPGCNLWFIADLWAKLIRALGYKKVIAQGGDFGAGVATALAMKHPEILSGLHLNYIHSSYLPFLQPGDRYTKEEEQYFHSAAGWYTHEGAYAHQQRTKPLTLAYGLNDSPAGLCAWILEKYHSWSDCGGDLESIFSKDELLANISLYWFTETIHSSIRLYNESTQAPLHFAEKDFIRIPVGIAHFHKEEPFPPRKFIERGYNVQYWTEISTGGHFAAMEVPALLSEEIKAFAEKIQVIQP